MAATKTKSTKAKKEPTIGATVKVRSRMHSDNTSLEKLVELYLDLRAEAKKKYIQADEILDQILETHEFKGQNIILPDGRLAVLQDNYSDRNKVFRSHGMNRFDIEEVKVKKSRKKA